MENNFAFNIIQPKPFILADQNKADLDKIVQEIMDKVTTWDKRMSTRFFPIYY